MRLVSIAFLFLQTQLVGKGYISHMFTSNTSFNPQDPFGDTQRTSYFDSSCYYTEKNGRHGEHLVHPYFLRKAYGLGERIANVTVAWKNSSYVRWG